MAGGFPRVHLELQSSIDVLDHVQHVTEDVSHQLGFDEDAAHWTSMAVRETVIVPYQALPGTHYQGAASFDLKRAKPSLAALNRRIGPGPKNYRASQENVRASQFAAQDARDLVVLVRDQGAGFDSSQLGDPLAPENILNTSGRGIFLVRQFMDDVSIRRAREGGMEVRLLKHL